MRFPLPTIGSWNTEGHSSSLPVDTDNSADLLDPNADQPLSDRCVANQADESIVIDDRSALTPAQAVENKLMALLKEASLPVSHLQLRGMVRYRGEN
jgi:hypothetical protein